ncbi:hypothetical protein [Luteitalea sp.]|uniref:hypothetical protein n=1 Tax=Luteitalea sp. TaxID=2004800 RepID=UPI0025BE804D|nr:hypothetical protein [Luteitalea sp.]
MKVTLDEQIKCVKREIAMRERVYPQWVRAGRMHQDEADTELRRMRAVLATLKSLPPSEAAQRALFDGPGIQKAVP